jgi:hypothetical protein
MRGCEGEVVAAELGHGAEDVGGFLRDFRADAVAWRGLQF